MIRLISAEIIFSQLAIHLLTLTQCIIMKKKRISDAFSVFVLGKAELKIVLVKAGGHSHFLNFET